MRLRVAEIPGFSGTRRNAMASVRLCASGLVADTSGRLDDGREAAGCAGIYQVTSRAEGRTCTVIWQTRFEDAGGCFVL